MQHACEKIHPETEPSHDREMTDVGYDGDAVDGDGEVEQLEDTNQEEAVTPQELEQEPSGEEVGGYVDTHVKDEDSDNEGDSDQDDALKELIKRKVEAVDIEGNDGSADMPQQTKYTATNNRVAANGCVVPNGGNLIIPTKRAGSQEAVVLQSNE